MFYIDAVIKNTLARTYQLSRMDVLVKLRMASLIEYSLYSLPNTLKMTTVTPGHAAKRKGPISELTSILLSKSRGIF